MRDLLGISYTLRIPYEIKNVFIEELLHTYIYS